MKTIKNTIVLVLLFLATIGYAQNEKSEDKLLHHVLLFHWAEGHNLDNKMQVLNLFKGLPNQVEGLESFEVLEVTNSTGNFDSVLIFKLTSEEALKQYEAHPDHARAAEIVPPLLSGYAQYDYWK